MQKLLLKRVLSKKVFLFNISGVGEENVNFISMLISMSSGLGWVVILRQISLR